jgi:hypothetical protein
MKIVGYNMGCTMGNFLHTAPVTHYTIPIQTPYPFKHHTHGLLTQSLRHKKAHIVDGDTWVPGEVNELLTLGKQMLNSS